MAGDIYKETPAAFFLFTWSSTLNLGEGMV